MTNLVAGLRRRSADLSVGLAAGVLVALSIPPFGWWPLGWLGLALVATALPGRRWPARLALGAGLGVGDYVPGLYWVHEFSIPGYVALVVLSSLWFVAAFLLVPSGSWARVAVTFPCLVVVAEWGRDHFPLGGFPLAALDLGQADGPLAPVLRLGGGLALTGETALVAVALAGLWRFTGRWRPAPAGAGPRLAVTATAAAAVLAAALPAAATLSPSGTGGDLPPMTVALVQGGGPRGTRAVNTAPQVVFDRHLAASAGVRPPVDLVVWPEGVLQSDRPFMDTPDAAAVADLARRLHATVVVGVEQDVGVNRYLNEVVAWDPSGAVDGSYVKNHLVPFGEYIPWRSFISSLFNVADVPFDAVPGRGPGFLRTPAGPLAVMISYEVFFDSRARGGVRAGGEVLVVPTNTSSYRSSQVPTQEVAADRMRAWETGRWLVQVTPTGYATVVTPTGDVVRKTRLGARQVLTAVVPVRTGMTVFDELGDTPFLVAAAAGWLGAAGVVAAARRRAAGSQSSRSA